MDWSQAEWRSHQRREPGSPLSASSRSSGDRRASEAGDDPEDQAAAVGGVDRPAPTSVLVNIKAGIEALKLGSTGSSISVEGHEEIMQAYHLLKHQGFVTRQWEEELEEYEDPNNPGVVLLMTRSFWRSLTEDDSASPVRWEMTLKRKGCKCLWTLEGIGTFQNIERATPVPLGHHYGTCRGPIKAGADIEGVIAPSDHWVLRIYAEEFRSCVRLYAGVGR